MKPVDDSATIPYKLAKTLMGKHVVKFQCPHCKEALESGVERATESDTCPHCSAVFRVPGEAARRQYEKLVAEKAESKNRVNAEKAAKLAAAEVARKAETERLIAEERDARTRWEAGNAQPTQSPAIKAELVRGPETLESLGVKLAITQQAIEKLSARYDSQAFRRAIFGGLFVAAGVVFGLLYPPAASLIAVGLLVLLLH